MSKPGDALAIAQCAINCLSDCNAYIFVGVVVVNVEITLGFDIEIQQAM
jgi:hypothetical protein